MDHKTMADVLQYVVVVIAAILIPLTLLDELPTLSWGGFVESLDSVSQ